MTEAWEPLPSDIEEAIWLQNEAPAAVAREQATLLTRALAEQAVRLSPTELEILHRRSAA